MDDCSAIGEVAARARGWRRPALRYYEEQGLISATRTPGGARRYPRSVLRRLAFIRAARNVGLSLPEIRAALDTLPAGTAADGRPTGPGCPGAGGTGSTSRSPRSTQLRDGLTSCIGCGCLSLGPVRAVQPRRRGRRARGRAPGGCRRALRRTPPVS